MARVRVRQHVNPLNRRYQVPVPPPDWREIYADLTQPLHLDIGCGWGVFLLQMAEEQPDWNFLGLEIRKPLLETAIAERDKSQLANNLHYLFCNVNTSLKSLLESLPPNQLQRVSIQFPDPWFKNRHRKRRVVKPELVADLAAHLAEGGEVFLQSDVQQIAREMCDRFSENPAFSKTHDSDWLPENPFPAATDRELATLEQGKPVYRALYVRKQQS